MKKIETAIKRKDNTQYVNDISSIGIFLRHSEDKIIIKNGETVNIEIYDNGILLFSGDKYELFEKLK